LRSSLLLLGILLVAANLRAALTAVGPILPLIADDGIGPTKLGVLVALPVGAFALVSPIVHRVAARLGMERAVLLALVVLAAGTVVRSVFGEAGMWVGTAIVGSAIAVGNVLLPAVAKRDFPRRIPMVTAQYIAVQSVVAALASGLSVPLARAWGAWNLSLAIWCVPVICAAAVWLPRLKRPGLGDERGSASSVRQQPTSAGVSAGVWRQPGAWHVAVYFMIQSSVFYTLMNWMPTVEGDMGISAAAAGWHLALFLTISIAANFAVPGVIHRGGDQRLAAVGSAGLMVIAMAGMLAVPTLQLMWVALGGFSSGASMVVSLSLIGLRAGSTAAAGQLSAMVQGIAYSGVAVTLVIDGFVRLVAGPGTHLLVLVLVLALLQLWSGFTAGRQRRPL
jgi:MFS transporter, CP family, cyanate transporter